MSGRTFIPRRPGLILLVVIDVLFVLVPLLIAIVMSFGRSTLLTFPPQGFTLDRYTSVATDSSWVSAAKYSLIIALLVMALTTVVGLAASLAIIRGRVPLRGLLAALLVMPTVTPLMVLALGTGVLFTSWDLTDSVFGLVIGQSALALPFVVINCCVSLRAMDVRIETAAASLGAPPWRVFVEVTVPLIRRGIVAGAIFAFLASWDDATVALFLNGPNTTTLPVYLLQQIQDYVSPEIAAVAGYLTIFALFALTLMVVTGADSLPGRANRRRKARAEKLTAEINAEELRTVV